MRKIIRIVFAVLFAFIGYVTVSLWPVSPVRWEQKLDVKPGLLLGGFYADGKSIYAYERRDVQGSTSPLEIVKRDTESGRELSRVSLASESSYASFVDDAKIIIASYRRFAVYDAQNGNPLLDPVNVKVPYSDLLVGSAISPDGQWIIFYFREACVVFSTKTGARITTIEIENSNESPEASAFAPDGKSVAILTSIPSGGGIVRIIDCHSFRILKRFTVPRQIVDGRSLAWDGQYCTVVSYAVNSSNQRHRKRTLIYDVSEEPIGEGREDPLRSYEINRDDHTACLEGKGWIANLRHRELETPWWFRTAVFIDMQLGTKLSKDYPDKSLTVFDKATGTWQKPIGLDRAELWVLSPDGHRVAVSSSNRGPTLKMMATYSSPRWPWALGTAFLIFILVFFLPRLRRRTKAQQPISS
jgi:hypothetical protein